jgi:hypothetical protein
MPANNPHRFQRFGGERLHGAPSAGFTAEHAGVFMYHCATQPVSPTSPTAWPA